AYSVTLNLSPLSDATLTATVTATDAAGNASSAVTDTATLDTSPPSTPAIASVLSDATSPATGNDPTPPLVVTGATPGATVKIFSGATLLASKAAAGPAVTFNALPSDTELTLGADGTYALTATATDAAGNASAASAAFSYILETGAPAVTAIASILDDTASPASGNDPTPSLVVSGVTPGDTVRIFEGSTELASAVAAGTSVTFNALPTEADFTLTDGEHVLTSTATDPVGNASGASTAFTYLLDTTAPVGPVIASLAGDAATPAVADEPTPRIVVTGANAGDLVKIFDGASEIGSKMARDSTVAFNAEPSDADLTLGPGEHVLTARLVDAFGNASEPSEPFTVLVNLVHGRGYWLVGEDGGLFAFGDAGFFGSTGGMKLNAPIVAIAPTPTALGYWMVASDGGLFAFGDAEFFGSTGGTKLNAPIVAIEVTPTGNGYWLVAQDGGLFAFGDAGFFGSTAGMKLNKPIVSMEATPSGNGYWMTAAEGGMFAFGDAGFFGSTGGLKLNQPITGIAATPTGLGYWLVATDGGLFAFGDAGFFGSTGGMKLNSPIVSIESTPSGAGYWMTAADGGMFSFGDAPFLGSTGGIKLNSPITAIGAP
ncbi:MAG: hypothetical protein ACRDHK_07395, partial [Actinomycetota bacterium]